METQNRIEEYLLDSARLEPYLKRWVREHIFPSQFINYGRNRRLAQVIGFVGPRGSTKSLSGAAMTIIDYLIPGYNVWSNMEISYGLKVLGDYYVAYQTHDIDKANFMKMRMGTGMVLWDEINFDLSEARRTMTNRNLQFNKVIQSLRHKSLNFIYTTQHEMWVDTRLRWQTDIFIRCEDILLKPGGFKYHFEFGSKSEWTVFDMSGHLGGGTYYQTGRPFGTWGFNAKQWWGTYDYMRDYIAESNEEVYGKPDIKESDNVLKAERDWGWLFNANKELCNIGIHKIEAGDLYNHLQIKERDISPQLLGRQLKRMNWETRISSGRMYYILPTANLDKPETMQRPDNYEL